MRQLCLYYDGLALWRLITVRTGAAYGDDLDTVFANSHTLKALLESLLNGGVAFAGPQHVAHQPLDLLRRRPCHRASPLLLVLEQGLAHKI